MKVNAYSLVAGLVLALGMSTQAHARARSTSPHLCEATIQEREDSTTQHAIVVSLELRNRDELERFLADVQNPNSPTYGQFITQDEFNARYAPTADAEQRVADYLEANGNDHTAGNRQIHCHQHTVYYQYADGDPDGHQRPKPDANEKKAPLAQIGFNRRQS